MKHVGAILVAISTKAIARVHHLPLDLPRVIHLPAYFGVVEGTFRCGRLRWKCTVDHPSCRNARHTHSENHCKTTDDHRGVESAYPCIVLESEWKDRDCVVATHNCRMWWHDAWETTRPHRTPPLARKLQLSPSKKRAPVEPSLAETLTLYTSEKKLDERNKRKIKPKQRLNNRSR